MKIAIIISIITYFLLVGCTSTVNKTENVKVDSTELVIDSVAFQPTDTTN